jgi:hypothetical protein
MALRDMEQAGLWSHAYWVGSVLQTAAEKTEYLRAHYPDQPTNSINAAARLLTDAAIAAYELQQSGETLYLSQIPRTPFEYAAPGFRYLISVDFEERRISPGGRITYSTESRLKYINSSEQLTYEELVEQGLQWSAESQFQDSLPGGNGPDTVMRNVSVNLHTVTRS